MITHDVALVQI